jgi:hypothetical protein
MCMYVCMYVCMCMCMHLLIQDMLQISYMPVMAQNMTYLYVSSYIPMPNLLAYLSLLV